MTAIATTADAITRALWATAAAHCPPDGAVLAIPGRDGRKVWPGEHAEAGVEWCHDCTLDGFGFIRARMLSGSECVTVEDDGQVAWFRCDSDDADLVQRVIGKGVSGRERDSLLAALSI
jgi:hypothetical protein